MSLKFRHLVIRLKANCVVVFFFGFSLFNFSLNSFADEMRKSAWRDSVVDLFQSAKVWDKFSFLKPNELNIKYLFEARNDDQLEARHFSGDGLLTLGSDRALFSFIFDPHLQYLIIVDADPNIILYHQINLAILEMASHFEEYVSLRQQFLFSKKISVSPAQWKSFLSHFSGETERVTPEKFQKLMNDWKKSFFEFEIDDNSDWLKFRPKLDSVNWMRFLEDPQLFLKLKNALKTGRIHVKQLDLRDAESVDFIRDMIKILGPIRRIDISNAWWNDYMGQDASYRFLRQILQYQSAVFASKFSPSSFFEKNSLGFQLVLTDRELYNSQFRYYIFQVHHDSDLAPLLNLHKHNLRRAVQAHNLGFPHSDYVISAGFKSHISDCQSLLTSKGEQ